MAIVAREKDPKGEGLDADVSPRHDGAMADSPGEGEDAEWPAGHVLIRAAKQPRTPCNKMKECEREARKQKERGEAC